MATEVASLYARVGADMSGFKRGMSEFNRSIHSAGGAFRNFTSGIVQGMGQAFGYAAMRGIREFGDAMSDTIKNAAGFEQGVADISAILGATAEDSARIGKLIKDLGIDPKLKVTATEAATAIEMLAKNGLALDDILGGAARSTILLSNSTGGDFALAADIATSAMAQFKIKAADMTTAVNQITGVTRNSKFDINDYRLAIAQAGGVAASVGVGFDDFNASIAAIAPLFASGSDAGTSFKTFLQRLVPDTDPAFRAMSELGLITAEGKSKFFEASGQMKSMSEIAGILQLAFAGLTEEQKISAATNIFGTDAMRAAFALADAGAGTIDKLKKAIGNTSAEESAAIRMDTLSGDWEIFQGIVETLSISIGEKFLPHARSIVQWATQMATDKGPAVVEFFGKLADRLPALGRMAVNFWNMISGPGVVKTVTMLYEAFDVLGKTLATLVRPFKEAFSGLFQELQAMRSTGFSDIFSVVMRRLGQAIKGFADAIRKDIAPAVLKGLGDLWKGVISWVNSIKWEDIVGWAKAIWGWAVDMWAEIYPHLVDFWTELSSWVTDPAKRKQLWDAVVTGWNVFTEYAAAVWNWMSPGLIAAWDYLSSWITDPAKRKQLWDAVVTGWNVFTEYAAAIWNWMLPGLIAAWNYLSSWVTDPAKRQTLWNAVVTGWNVFTEWAAAIWNWMSPGLIAAWNYLSSWVTDPAKRDIIYAQVVRWGEALTGWANYLWNGGEGFGGLRAPLVRWWNEFDQWMKENFPNTRQQLGELTKAFKEFFAQLDTLLRTDMNGIKQTWDEIWKNMFGNAKQNWDLGIAEILKNSKELVDILRGVGMVMEGWKTNTWGPIWRGMWEIVTSAWAILKSNLDVNPFFQGLLGVLSNWGNKIKGAWQFLMNGLVEAVRSGMIALAGAWAGIGNIITQGLQGAMQNVKAWADGVADSIMRGLVDGIKQRLQWLTDIGSDLARAVLDPIKKALGIASPSKVFRQLGENVAQGFALGIGDRMELPALSVNKMVRHTVDAAQGGGVTGGSQSRLDVYIHAETTLPTNRPALQELARMLQRELVLAGGRASY